MSIVRPFLKQEHGHYMRKSLYYLTRRYLVVMRTAWYKNVTPLRQIVWKSHVGYTEFRRGKLNCSLLEQIQNFSNHLNNEERRKAYRSEFGFTDDDLICVYTGRFSHDKNPYIIAQAASLLQDEGKTVKVLFVGDGPQKSSIEAVKRNEGFTVRETCRPPEILPAGGYWNLADTRIHVDA